MAKLTIPIELMADYDLWNSFLDRCVPRLQYVRVEEPIDSLTNYGPAHLSMFLSFFAHHSRDLRELTLRGKYEIPCPLLQVLSRNCPHLHALDVQGEVSFFGWDRIGISTQLHALRSLTLKKSNLADHDISPLLDLCPNLEALELGNSNGITQNGLVDVFNSHAPLKTIKIQGMRYLHGTTIMHHPVLRVRPELTEVALDCIVSDEFLTALSHSCPSLTHLSVKNSSELTRVGILSVSRACTQLTDLTIAHCRRVPSDIRSYFSHSVLVDFTPSDTWFDFPIFPIDFPIPPLFDEAAFDDILLQGTIIEEGVVNTNLLS